jgi:hypothetical protein
MGAHPGQIALSFESFYRLIQLMLVVVAGQLLRGSKSLIDLLLLFHSQIW